MAKKNKKKKPAARPATKKRAAVKAKRTASKTTTQKSGKKSAKKTAKKSVKKARRTPARKAAPKVADGLQIIVPPTLEDRLQALANSMGLSLGDVFLQALMEFADTWEDHQRTVAALNDGDDRMQLVVPRE